MWRSPWQKLINRSEKIVGYPSSFINIRYLISDELATVATQVRRLVGTKHPLLQTARALIGDSQGVAQIRGLIVLLISKTFNDKEFSINSPQRSLSEIVETASAAISIHRGLINVDENNTNAAINWKSDMQFGNKMSTLCGDFLLASVSQALAELRNTEIVDTISQGIGDSIESTFIKKNINDEIEYKHFVYLANGSLFSRCCRAAVTLGNNQLGNNTNEENCKEEIAENWAIKWSELYALCEDIDLMLRQLTGGKVKSKILQSKITKQDNIEIAVENLGKYHSLLYKTRASLQEAHKQIPEHNKSAREILEEMSALLYEDAMSNIKVFI